MKNTRRAADVIVERLIEHEVRHVFAVAGESYLDMLDALHDARRPAGRDLPPRSGSG
jgi:thiamine pyrophosphate-dependent acetolactate synthase large subunit-like protein